MYRGFCRRYAGATSELARHSRRLDTVYIDRWAIVQSEADHSGCAAAAGSALLLCEYGSRGERPGTEFDGWVESPHFSSRLLVRCARSHIRVAAHGDDDAGAGSASSALPPVDAVAGARAGLQFRTDFLRAG